MAYRWDRFIGRQESATSYVACRMNSAISPSGEVRSQSAGSCNAFALFPCGAPADASPVNASDFEFV
mgnify:CR=1 FL=1